MKLKEVYEIIQIIEKSNLGQLKHENKEIETKLNLIGDFIRNLTTLYDEELKVLDETSVRFCDYYDMGVLHSNEIINYFEENYFGKDKDTLINVFALYVILKNVQDLVYNFDICDNIKELYSLLNFNYYFEDIIELINFINERKLENTNENNSNLDFLTSNKYQIFFTGYTLEDLKKLDKNALKGFLRKLSGELSNAEYVPLSEGITHVRDAYNFPISRIRYSRDYRITYLRKDNVTTILGVSKKTGNVIEYERFDTLAMKNNKIFEEIQAFRNNQLPSDAQHYQVVEELTKVYEEINTNSKK